MTEALRTILDAGGGEENEFFDVDAQDEVGGTALIYAA